jgi:hypothetical protein
MADLKEVAQVMAFLAALYPRYQLTEPTIKAYASILADIPADALTAAAEKLGAESTFFPAAAELRQMAYDLSQGDDLPLAIQGWQQLMDHWSGRRIEFHRLTTETINAMGGLRRLGNTHDDDMPFVRAQFIKTFETLRNRVVEDRRQLPSVKEYKRLQASRAMDELAERLRLNDGGK